MAFTDALGGSLPIIAAVIWFVLATMVLRAGKDQLFNALFFALYALSALKSVAESVIGFMTHTPGFFVSAPWFPTLEWWYVLSYVCLAGMLPIYVWFVSIFPRPHNVFARNVTATAALFVIPSTLTLLLIIFLFQPGVLPFSIERIGNAYNVTALGYTGYALLVLVQAYRAAKHDIERHRTKLVLLAFAIITVPSWVTGILQLTGSGFQLDFLIFYAPLIELVAAATIAFAILKYQLLGVELIAKATLKQSVTVGSLSIVFFVTKETLNSLLGDLFNARTGYLIGAVLGGILFLPIEKGSRKLMNKLFPDVNDTEDYLRKRKLDIYKEQLAVAMADGQLKDKELKMLALLRQTLGLTEEDVKRIEEAASPFLSGVLKATSPAEPAK